MRFYEVNFDGLVGPTHNHAGLSHGNVASRKNSAQISHPKQAALQGLKKMKTLADLGVPQGVLPPHFRPNIGTLKSLGFNHSDPIQLLEDVAKQAPNLLTNVSSASNMWVANAATVSPSLDTKDNKTHFTPANLSSMFHRSIEHETTGKILKKIFSSDDFAHHSALPSGTFFSDEGAANHTRFAPNYGVQGVEFFVYGKAAFGFNRTQEGYQEPDAYPARQTLESCEAIARVHNLHPEFTVIAQQNPEAIDAGVFHNDVIAVGDRNLLFYHEKAFLNTREVIAALSNAYLKLPGATESPLTFIEVSETSVSLSEAVSTYLFNSQLVKTPDSNGFTIVVPKECQNSASVSHYLSNLQAEHPLIDDVLYFDLKQSMKNGGGPACLRLRVVLSEHQMTNLGARALLTDDLYAELTSWVNRHYRDTLSAEDLLSPSLYRECYSAFQDLVQIMQLDGVYEL